MTLFEQLRRLFQRSTIPEEARRVYEASKSTDELVMGMEQVLGRNRIEYGSLQEEKAAAARAVRAARARLVAGGLDPDDEDRLMDDLELQQAHLAPLRTSLGYLKTNMLVLYRLIGVVRERQARELRGLTEDDIDGILESVGDELKKYTQDMAAAADSDDLVGLPDEAAEEAERAERRRRLLGQDAVTERPETKERPRQVQSARTLDTE
jgi:hypothetical protein